MNWKKFVGRNDLVELDQKRKEYFQAKWRGEVNA